jgi:tetratricopeptide (TPR) repeat protein
MSETQKRPSKGKSQPQLKNKMIASQENNSLQAASNALSIYFQSGDYQAAENLAKNIISQFPDHALSWKVLGAALKNLGKLEESLEAKKKAALLSPQDAEALYNLGTTLQGLGRLEEAISTYKRAIIIKPDYAAAYGQLGIILNQLNKFEDAEINYKKAIEIKPDYAEALCNLGIALKELGRLEEAEASYNKAIALKPDLAVAYSNLATLLQQLGRLEDAEISYKKAIGIRPDHAESYNNLGNILKELRRLDESEVSYRKALSINPGFAEAHNNLANTLQEVGRIDAAIVSYKMAIRYKSDFAEVYFNLGSSYLYKNDLDEANAYFIKVININPNHDGLKSAVLSAVINMLSNNQAACKKLLIESSSVLKKDSSEFKNYVSYWRYLRGLLDWREINFQNDNSIEELDKVYVIGESHSLAYHNVLLKIIMSPFVSKSLWIMGCKQWHLGNKYKNQYKSAVQSHFTGISKNSTIVMVVGEIDCRINDGIIPYLKKNPQVSMEDAVSSTINGYLNYLSSIIESLGHHLIISGIPAPNIDFSLISPEDTKLLISLIQHFNMVLKRESTKLGFGFLDTYALTNNGFGKSNKEWHIDDYHLKPSAIQQLFSNHYLSGSNFQ